MKSLVYHVTKEKSMMYLKVSNNNDNNNNNNNTTYKNGICMKGKYDFQSPSFVVNDFKPLCPSFQGSYRFVRIIQLPM